MKINKNQDIRKFLVEKRKLKNEDSKNKANSCDNKLQSPPQRPEINKAFVGLGSCDNVQTERSIFEYANWARLLV